LPVLSDQERAKVGVIYVQDSRFRARKMGAAFVARNAAHHLENQLAEKDGSYRPLVYCWRGGQRSESFAVILAQLGWRVEVLKGGYRSYRSLVVDTLYDTPFPSPVVVLGGNTGTAKTDLLLQLQKLGHQVIDLEGLANHRGSLFGERIGGQPTQKAFENALAQKICNLDPARPVVVEAESNKIGTLHVPVGLWKAMCAAPRIMLEVPLCERAQYLTRVYGDIIADRDHLLKIICKLKRFHAANRIDEWQTLAKEGAFETLAAGLMEYHYDPRYIKQNAQEKGSPDVTLAFDDLSSNGLGRAAVCLSKRVTAVVDYDMTAQ
ncbi:MAG: tRNA 2-selenouridine(34) synthase MnmH, partial [Amylibacter sp.]